VRRPQGCLQTARTPTRPTAPRVQAEFYGLEGLTAAIDRFPWSLVRAVRAPCVDELCSWCAGQARRREGQQEQQHPSSWAGAACVQSGPATPPEYAYHPGHASGAQRRCPPPAPAAAPPALGHRQERSCELTGGPGRCGCKQPAAAAPFPTPPPAPQTPGCMRTARMRSRCAWTSPASSSVSGSAARTAGEALRSSSPAGRRVGGGGACPAGGTARRGPLRMPSGRATLGVAAQIQAHTCTELGARVLCPPRPPCFKGTWPRCRSWRWTRTTWRLSRRRSAAARARSRARTARCGARRRPTVCALHVNPRRRPGKRAPPPPTNARRRPQQARAAALANPPPTHQPYPSGGAVRPV
jgi:hypothetical protein